MTRTYSESQGEKPFNWNQVLQNDPPERGSEPHLQLVARAKSWVTCACGNQCEVIPRMSNGAPIDEELYCLGADFYDNIKTLNWDSAKVCLSKIEERSAQLIDIYKNNPYSI